MPVPTRLPTASHCPELPFPRLQNGRPLLPRGFGDEWARRGRGVPGPGTGRTGSRGLCLCPEPQALAALDLHMLDSRSPSRRLVITSHI